MAGIDINTILNAVPNKQTAVQKLATLLIKKVTENENLIQVPLNNLLKQLPTDGTCLEPALLQSVLDKRNNINFGIVEIFNRFIIVKSHKFNLTLFFLGSFVRFLLSLLNIFKGEFSSFFRACGNIAGIIKSFFYLIIEY